MTLNGRRSPVVERRRSRWGFDRRQLPGIRHRGGSDLTRGSCAWAGSPTTSRVRPRRLPARNRRCPRVRAVGKALRRFDIGNGSAASDQGVPDRAQRHHLADRRRLGQFAGVPLPPPVEAAETARCADRRRWQDPDLLELRARTERDRRCRAYSGGSPGASRTRVLQSGGRRYPRHPGRGVRRQVGTRLWRSRRRPPRGPVSR